MNEDTTSRCASCGIAEVDDIKLTKCTDCDLARYCSVKCQKNHWSQHEEACNKRATELRDELLFKQPESSHLGDCPICMIPLSLDPSKANMMSCCSKSVCKGCSHANNLRIDEGKLQHICPFCREPTPSTYEQCDKLFMKRIAANEPVAMLREGVNQDEKGHYRSAFEYFTKAAELGDVEAHSRLVLLYHHGHGVEKDFDKLIHHLEEAAIGGHPGARYKLGYNERINDRTERALKHLIIGATQGDDDSIKLLMDMFKNGMVNKEDLAAALRAHQAAVDATKSPQREAAEEFYRNRPVL
eukprot:scaffold35881_cov105-Skeletonema_marinoi.AAC.2